MGPPQHVDYGQGYDPSTTNSTADGVHPIITRPRAVPAAGGCSVLVTAMNNMLSPTYSTANRPRTDWDVETRPPSSGARNAAEKKVPTITETTWPPTTRRGAGGVTVGGNENDEGGGCDGDDYGGLERHVDYQQNNQQGHHGQRTLEQVAPPVLPELPVNQPASLRQALRRSRYAKLAHHKQVGILIAGKEICLSPAGFRILWTGLAGTALEAERVATVRVTCRARLTIGRKLRSGR